MRIPQPHCPPFGRVAVQYAQPSSSTSTAVPHGYACATARVAGSLGAILQPGGMGRYQVWHWQHGWPGSEKSITAKVLPPTGTSAAVPPDGPAAPTPEEYVPALHRMHSVSPVPLEYAPAWQSRQPAAAASRYLPAGQLAHAVVAMGEEPAQVGLEHRKP